MFAFFRKRYTSVTRVAFRPPPASFTPNDTRRPSVDTTAATAGTATSDHAPCPPTTNTTGHVNNNGEGSNASAKTTKGGCMCVEIQFTGPQPIEGPAGLMRNLLQATLVEAYPVQLDRGRKKKARSVGRGRAPTAAVPAAPSASSPPSGSGAVGMDLGAYGVGAETLKERPYRPHWMIFRGSLQKMG